MEILKILLVVLIILAMWLVLYKRSCTCPSCNKRIRKSNLKFHLPECARNIWYSLPVVPLSHISTLQVRIVDEKTWGVWDTMTGDWVKDSNNIIDARVLKSNASKLLKLIKAKSSFNELVDA